MVSFEFRDNSNCVNVELKVDSTKIDLGLMNKVELRDLASELVEAIDSISYHITTDGFDDSLSVVRSLVEELI